MDDELYETLVPNQWDSFELAWHLRQIATKSSVRARDLKGHRGKSRPVNCLYCGEKLPQSEDPRVMRKYCPHPNGKPGWSLCRDRNKAGIPVPSKERKCEVCQAPISGNVRKKYCSKKCNKKAQKRKKRKRENLE